VSRLGGETRTAFYDQISRAGVGEHVTPLVGDTVEMARHYPGRPIRLLLIDADHSYEGVQGDLEAWLPHVAPGGLIVFHDYLIPDVARFVNERVRKDPRVEFDPGKVLPNIVAVTRRRA
jgi:predicted O-methyltransferase YrrM